jgi:tetratricopeptide (TPR) repeat protein
MKRLLSLVALVLAVTLLPARAEGPDDQYVRIYNLMQQADTLNNSDQPAAALAKYLEAQTALQRFQKVYPDWNVKVVNFRLNYLVSKIAAVTPKVPAPVAPATPTEPAAPVAPGTPATAAPGKPVAAPDFERQLSALQDDVRKLQADKILLEMKLKEALATQPAAVDPRELSKAQEKIQSLLKENELLKTTSAAEPVKSPAGADPKVLAETQAALAEASRKLSDQTERANALVIEKKVLQSRLDSLTPSVENVAQLDRIKQARDEAERKLADQTSQAARLAAEKETLQARIKTLTASAEVADALRAENQILKQQLTEAKSSAGKSEDVSRQLAQSEARVAALQSDAEVLRLEKMALENRIKTLSVQTAKPSAAPPAGRAGDLQRIKLLESERNDLAKKLEAANKELYGRKGRATAVKVEELSSQITTLRARLEVFEARAIPYTAEELALFKKPETQLAVADPKAGKRAASELPRGTASLVAEAQRDFAAKRLDKAEEKYLEVLRQDEKNTFTLANLAAIQLELNRLDEADKNIQKALAIDPNDAYSLSILGNLRFRQGKNDEAFDALSRSAKLNPQSAEVQNFLGVTLSRKGLRGPAETALRKAIQLDPGYGAAHNNLAVIYATQQPPLVELARWHYQRALGAGHPRNTDLEEMFEQKAGAATKAQ